MRTRTPVIDLRADGVIGTKRITCRIIVFRSCACAAALPHPHADATK